MSGHVDRATLLAFFDEDPDIDRAAVETHLRLCDECRTALDDLLQLRNLLTDPAIFEYLESRPNEPRKHEELTHAQQRLHEEEERAVRFLAEISGRPTDEWPSIIEARSDECTEGLARHLVRLAERELDRDARKASALLDAAESVVDTFEGVLVQTYLADIWRNRANALRHLGEYPASLDAAELAEVFYDSLATGAFGAAQARYTRAVTLFKMTRYADALADLRWSAETLETFGDSLPLAKTMVLEGVIRFEQGERDSGAALWEKAVPILERLGERIDLARVQANIAEYEASNGRLDAAEARAIAAVGMFRSLGMDGEVVRSQWTLATITLARGDSSAGLRQLYAVAAGFQGRGMAADAAFVNLDIAEELVRRGAWEPAKAIAGALIEFFNHAGVTLGSVAAIQYLQAAIQKCESTPNLVRYVRDFVTANDADRQFEPPTALDLTN